MVRKLDETLELFRVLRDERLGGREREQDGSLLGQQFYPLWKRTAEAMKTKGTVNTRLSLDDLAEAGIPALIAALNSYDPDRTGPRGETSVPRTWIIRLLIQAMMA